MALQIFAIHRPRTSQDDALLHRRFEVAVGHFYGRHETDILRDVRRRRRPCYCAATLTEPIVRPDEVAFTVICPAVPFDWTFGRDDLDKLCRRLDAHRPAA